MEEETHSLICVHLARLLLVLALIIIELLEAALQLFMKSTTRWAIQDGLLTISSWFV